MSDLSLVGSLNHLGGAVTESGTHNPPFGPLSDLIGRTHTLPAALLQRPIRLAEGARFPARFVVTPDLIGRTHMLSKMEEDAQTLSCGVSENGML